ncbi:MAG: hypothetical protein HY769_01910 [Candidatus Stahlbacteria bacterium]|nr:hypothetical protein [Candidatus Stahlbacteria bacterium]
MDKNSEYVATYNKVIDAEFEKIENKSGDTLVYSFKDPEHKAEGIAGFISFIKDGKGDPRAPEANIMAITCSAENKQDTTIIIPFAFYFNQRPQNVEYELVVANETDTVWMGQVWSSKWSWGQWGRCTLDGTMLSAMWCAYSGPAFWECTGGGAFISAAGCAMGQMWK